ncbi:hypothetical protein B566_EDAN014551 [Ephemera danica]|nr:hypothetical protein B566_EDAN014551 [Ephemera danica]
MELGMEVDFTLASRNTPGGSCMSAENVKILPKGTIPAPAVDPAMHTGVVTRPLRSVEYAGLVRESITAEDTDVDGEGTETPAPAQYEFGIVGLANKRDLLQAGDPVTFQVDAEGRATNIVAEGKKLFFHTSEVAEGVSLQPGDSVEFVLVTNQRTGKECKRPERLISKLRSISLDDSGPRITVVRQPKGPDGTKGFSEPRLARQPGQMCAPTSLIIGEEENGVDIPPVAELPAVTAVEN